MKKNVCYCRVSSTEQSILHQKNSIQEYAKRNDIKIDEFISDEGVSAFSTHYTQREGLMRCIQMAREGNLSTLFVFESSRLSRKMSHFQDIIDIFTQHGVKIISTSDNTVLNQNEIDQLINAFKGWLNQQASVETSRRVASAKKLLREQGLFQGGVIPPFMKVEDRRLVPIDENLIKEFYEDYIRYGSKFCMKKYNIQSRGTVTRRIRNPLYQEYVGNLWNISNNIRGKRTCVRNETTKFSTRVDFLLLEGLLYHDYCGSKLVANKKYEGYYTFRCTKCRGQDIDVKKSFANNLLLPNVTTEIEQVLDELDHDKLIERYNTRCGKHKSILELKIKELTNILNSKTKTLKMASAKLERAILEDNDTVVQAVSNMISEVKSEIEQIEEELQLKNKELVNIIYEEKHQEELVLYVIHARDIYKGSNNEQKKAILNLLVRKISVRDYNDYDIYLNI